jgi:hypothetical protein
VPKTTACGYGSRLKAGTTTFEGVSKLHGPDFLIEIEAIAAA